MGLFGHCAVGFAVKLMAPKVHLAILLIATEFFDLLATALGYAGIEGGAGKGNPWSHGLFMSVIWSLAFALLAARIFRNTRAGVAVGLAMFSHWILDLISHPIPFSSFSWSTWRWDYGHPLAPDLMLFFAGSPRVGFGLYNSISAVAATALETAMLILGAAVYAAYVMKEKRKSRMQGV
jgi:hypothetical protein